MNTDLNAQTYLNTNLTDQTTKKIKLSPLTKQEIAWKEDTIAVAGKLTGDLIIQDFPQLEEIGLKNHELTSLTISNCPRLKHLNVRNNQLTKLEISGTSEITELIASGNQLTNLNLTNAQQLQELIIPDNPYLSEIKGWNLATLKNINLKNTLLNLAEDYQQLQGENEILQKALKWVDSAGSQQKLVLTEAIQTPKQAEEAIKRLLKETEQEWREYFESQDPNIGQKKPLLHLNFQYPARKRKAKQILKLIVETQTSGDYQGLADKWNGGETYNPEDDFDFSLFKLLQYLGVPTNNPSNQTTSNLLNN